MSFLHILDPLPLWQERKFNLELALSQLASIIDKLASQPPTEDLVSKSHSEYYTIYYNDNGFNLSDGQLEPVI